MKQLDPKAVWLLFVSYVFRLLIPIAIFGSSSLVALSEATSEGDVNVSMIVMWVVLGLIVYTAFCYVWARLTYRYYRYELTDLGFRKESGVIYKKYVTIPYDRIQNVDIYRGILSRMFGLSDLHIQTAGMSASFSQYGAMGVGTEGRLQGVSKQDAELLRDELILRTTRNRNQGL